MTKEKQKLPNKFYNDIAKILETMIDSDLMFLNTGFFHYKGKKYEVNIDIGENIRWLNE